MKYDEMIKLEVNSYPNENVVKESEMPRLKRMKNPTQVVNAALFVAAVGAGTSVAVLVTTVINLATSGQLSTVFMSLLG